MYIWSFEEQMLKSGQVWHFKTYDKRPEFAQWESEARAGRRGLLALENPGNHGIGEETSAMRTFRSTNGAVPNDLIGTYIVS
nr:unnamed protein product [Digitaria exilis]